MSRRMQGAVLALLGLGSMAEAWRITATVRETATFDVLGPDRYLLLTGGLLLLAGLMLIATRGIGVVAAPSSVTDGSVSAAATMLAALAAFALAIPWTGFEAACFGFFVAAFGLVSRWSLLPAVAGAFAAMTLLHVVFVRLADVPLPRSAWQAWLGSG